MSPEFALPHPQDSAVGNPELCGEFCMGLSRAAYRNHVINTQLCTIMGFAMSNTTSLNSIGGVLPYGSNEEMSRIDATAVVAGVSDNEVGWYAGICKRVSNAMRVILSTLSPREWRPANHTVPVIVEGASPRPAFIRATPIYKVMEFLSKRITVGELFGSSAERLRVALYVAKFLAGTVPSRTQITTARRALFHACIIATMATAGCASVSPATDSCAWVKPIYVSKQDVLTDGTVDQILAHNEKWQEICE